MSQSISSDSAYYKLAIANIKSQSIMPYRLSLYNGYEHRGYLRDIKGSAYFSFSEMTPGSVKYNNIWYSLPLIYDLVSDEVVITHYDGFYKMALIKDFVGEFIIDGHIFKRINTDNGKNIPSGFYEQLYSGNMASLYARRSKIIKETATTQKIEREFLSRNQYYIHLNNGFYLIKSQSAMLELMADKKKEIISSLKERRVKFRKNMEEALMIAVKKYDETL